MTPGKLQFARSIRCDRGLSTTESRHAALNQSLSFSSLLLVRQPQPTCEHVHIGCDLRQHP